MAKKHGGWVSWELIGLFLRYFLNELYDRSQKPLMIVENGLGAEDHLEADGSVHGPYCIDYLRFHIQAMIGAVEDGVELMGYTIWGCTGLASASTGEMHKRYGFVYVGKDNDGNGDLKRHREDSFYWYQKVIASSGEGLA